MLNHFDPTIESILEDPLFGAVKHYVLRTTGLCYYEDKDGDLALAIARASKEDAFTSGRNYLAQLSTEGSPALDRLVEELTIGETFFFRHAEMFTALKEHVFPEIQHRKKEEKRLRIWSAGCSIGAEPYSLSILLQDELAHRFKDWSIEIIGTDINRRFLEIARTAAYESWALRGVPDEMRSRYFDRKEGRWVLKPRYTRNVIFQHQNLVKDRFPSLGNNLFALDLVICRNVMIYFNTETVRRLAEQFHQSLVSGGWLAVGHAEPHTETFRAFRTVNVPGAILYQRPTVDSSPEDTFAKWTRVDPPLVPKGPPPWSPPSLTLDLPEENSITPPVILVSGSEEELPQVGDLELARRVADSGDLAAARAYCEQLTERENLDAAVHFFHGLILEQSGELEMAHEGLRRAIYLARELVLAHYHLGLIQQKLRQPIHALRSFRNTSALLDKYPDDWLVPFGDGLTAGDLRSLITRQIGHF